MYNVAQVTQIRLERFQMIMSSIKLPSALMVTGFVRGRLEAQPTFAVIGN